MEVSWERRPGMEPRECWPTAELGSFSLLLPWMPWSAVDHTCSYRSASRLEQFRSAALVPPGSDARVPRSDHRSEAARGPAPRVVPDVLVARGRLDLCGASLSSHLGRLVFFWDD